MMKKTFSLILALVMILAMAVPAFAAEETYTVTIENNAKYHHYDAYQIFAGSLSADGKTLSNVTWGESVKDGAALMAALKADTTPIKLAGDVTTTLSEKLANVEDSASALAEYLSKNVDPVDSAILDRIAEIIGTATEENGEWVHTYLNAPVETSVEGEGTYTISNLPAGYYLIKDRDGTVENVADFYTKYLIKVVGTQTIGVKGEGVSVEKFINDTVDGTYGDHEDFDVNDTAYYMWQGQLPSNLLSYDEYFYQFVDTLPVGVEFIRLEAVYIQDDDGRHVHTFMNLNDASTENDTLPASMVLETEGKTITLTIENLLTAYSLIQPDHEVVVKYSALITREALMSKAMTNSVYLVIDNNPSGEGRGKTVPDYAHAFSFPLNIYKYDAAAEDKTAAPLAGAEFILYFTRIENEAVVHYYAKVVTEEDIYAADGSLKSEEERTLVEGREPMAADNIGLVYGWTTNREEADILDTDATGYIKIYGLDAGIYYLEETKAPDGYNKLNSVIKVEIEPEYSNTDTENASVTVTYHVDDREQGSSSEVQIGNSKGATLPTTGGMGTTMFYIFGGFLAVAAVVLLVTKKRMAQN